MEGRRCGRGRLAGCSVSPVALQALDQAAEQHQAEAETDHHAAKEAHLLPSLSYGVRIQLSGSPFSRAPDRTISRSSASFNRMWALQPSIR